MRPSFDPKLLAARALRPKRNDPFPAKKAIRGITDPVEAWKILAATLPPALAHDPARSFERTPFVLAADAPPSAPSPGRDVVETPPTIGACLAVALDPEGFLAAEEHAREAVRRLAPWGVQPRGRIVWSIVPAWPAANQGGEPPHAAVWMCLQKAARVDKKATMALGAAYRSAADQVIGELALRTQSLVEQKLCEPFVDAAGFAAQWQRACETGVVVPEYEIAPGVNVPAAGRRFADLPDPFEPLLALITRGYWLSGVTDDALILVATEHAGRSS